MRANELSYYIYFKPVIVLFLKRLMLLSLIVNVPLIFVTCLLSFKFGDNFLSSLIVGVIGFISGFLLRAHITTKQKKKLIKLEDQMLINHSRILSLETKIATLEEENNELQKIQQHNRLKGA